MHSLGKMVATAKVGGRRHYKITHGGFAQTVVLPGGSPEGVPLAAEGPESK